MESIEVSRQNWMVFFDHVSRAFRGRRVTVRQCGTQAGLESVAEGFPFLEISADEPREGLEPVVSVMLGNANDGKLVEALAAPQHVRVTESGAGEVTLQIESRTGIKTCGSCYLFPFGVAWPKASCHAPRESFRRKTRCLPTPKCTIRTTPRP